MNVEGRGQLNNRPLEGKQKAEVRGAGWKCWPLCAEFAVMCRSPRPAVGTA